MLGGCAGLLLNWARQGTCACEPWGREKPKRTAPGEALVSRHRTRVQFPPPPPLSWWPRHAVAVMAKRASRSRDALFAYAVPPPLAASARWTTSLGKQRRGGSPASG